MFHKVKSIKPLDNYLLRVQFSEGVTKIYDMKPWFKEYPRFLELKQYGLFYDVSVDVGGYGVIWNDELDLSCDELFSNGVLVKSPFDGLMSFGDATLLWGLNESTLRKAIKYGKLVEGVDVCKYGKQWVILIESMKREYGEPKI